MLLIMPTSVPIRTKRVYEAPEPADGTRILIDRLWPRGLAKADAGLAEWLKDVAPSDELRHWFGHDPSRFAEFTRRYRAELADKADDLDRLEALARKGPLTLVYAAHDAEHNNAQVLADVLRERLAHG